MAFCTRCGKQIEEGQICGCSPKATMTDSLNIFENEITPCEGEEKVKAYRISELRQRSFFRNAVATGILTVTNKRVIYRTDGIKKNADFIHSEVPIEDISGISINKGKCSDPLTTIVMIVVAVLVIGIPIFLVQTNGIGSLFIYLLILLAVLFLICLVKYRGVLSKENILNFLKSIARLFSLTRPMVVMKINSKSASCAAVEIASTRALGKDMSLANEPLEDVHLLSNELGAIINDIQKNGFYSGV